MANPDQNQNQHSKQDQTMTALIELHRGLERLGPGDPEFSTKIISQIGPLPLRSQVVDMGCGTGAGALLLARHLDQKVLAQDLSQDFLDELEVRAKAQGLDHLIDTEKSDMGKLQWLPGSVGLLWSEGSAYNLTFDGALKNWRPFMATHGVAVISELSFFTANLPDDVLTYWQREYPTIGTEDENRSYAIANGFEVIETRRLPSTAWWKNYYSPLVEQMAALAPLADDVMRSVIKQTQEEMDFFKAYHRYYGYTFYILNAVL